jgi:hypothetical protein
VSNPSHSPIRPGRTRRCSESADSDPARPRREIRRAGWRDAARVGALLARAHRRVSARHPDALAFMVRPRLARALLMWTAGVLMTVLAETWITGAATACLTIQRAGSPWRFRACGLGWVLVGGVVAGVVGFAVYGALRALLPPVAAELLFDVPVLTEVGFMMTFVVVELAGNPLRRARGRIRRVLAGPVWHVGALASIEPGAGRALGQALAAMADAHHATLVAEADGRARVRLYRAAGFTEAA